MIRYCPKCNADFQGEPIPEADRRWFGDATHFSHLIAVYDRAKDRTVAWRCPDCGHQWERV